MIRASRNTKVRMRTDDFLSISFVLGIVGDRGGQRTQIGKPRRAKRKEKLSSNGEFYDS